MNMRMARSKALLRKAEKTRRYRSNIATFVQSIAGAYSTVVVLNH